MTFPSSSSQKESKLSINNNLEELAKRRGWLFQVTSPASTQVSYPSNTIEEDILYVIQHWADLLKIPSEKRNQLGREEHFYHLHCTTSYEIDETFLCAIPCATVLNQMGLIATSDGEIIRQSLDGQRRTIDLDLAQVKEILDVNQVMPGIYVSLLSCFPLNFAHWLMDCLPKLALLDVISDVSKTDLKFIIPEKPPKYILESLQLLGIQENQIIHLPEKGIKVEKLFLCHVAQNPGRPNKQSLLKIRKQLLASCIKDNSSYSGSRRIYISRSQSSRKIVNEDELLQILTDYGFEILYCEQMTLVEQIQVFSNAEVIIGPHGAGIYNQIFCHFGTTIIEIYNKEYWHHSSRIIASFMGHTHWHIFGENVSQDWQTWVDPLKFKELLSLAFFIRPLLTKSKIRNRVEDSKF